MSNPNIHSMLEEHPFCVVKTSMFGAYDVTMSPTILRQYVTTYTIFIFKNYQLLLAIHYDTSYLYLT